MADAFARLGTKVTIIEAAGQLLPREEPLAAQVLADAFADLGITLRTGSGVVRVAPAISPDGMLVSLDDGSSVAADKLLVAVGRHPFTADLGLEAAGVEVDAKGFIKVVSHLRTSASGNLRRRRRGPCAPVHPRGGRDGAGRRRQRPGPVTVAAFRHCLQPLGALFSEVRRVLRPGGTAAFMFPGSWPLGARDLWRYGRLMLVMRRAHLAYPNDC